MRKINDKIVLLVAIVVGVFYAPQDEFELNETIHGLETLIKAVTTEITETEELVSKLKKELDEPLERTEEKISKSKKECLREMTELEKELAYKKLELEDNNSNLELQKARKESLLSQSAKSKMIKLHNIEVGKEYMDKTYMNMAMSALGLGYYAELNNGVLYARAPKGNLFFSLNFNGMMAAKMSIEYLRSFGVSLHGINGVSTIIKELNQSRLLELHSKLMGHPLYTLEARLIHDDWYDLTLTPIHLPAAPDESLKHIRDEVPLKVSFDEGKKLLSFSEKGKFLFGLALDKVALKHSLKMLPIKIVSIQTDMDVSGIIDSPESIDSFFSSLVEVWRDFFGIFNEMRGYSAHWRGSLTFDKSTNSYALNLILKSPE